MAQPMMDDYRARKLEDEFFEKASFKRPCELILKHGRSRMSYWGIPEIVHETVTEADGHKITTTSVIWRTKKDQPAMVQFSLPGGMKLENVMSPCKYMETDRGYQNVISLVIGGLIAMNLLNFYLFVTMADVGTDAFQSPIFIGPFCLIMGSIIAAMRFNQTHFTHRLSLECFEAELEQGKYHYCYAVDCDIPVHKQLMFENTPALLREALKNHQVGLNETYWDLRTQIGEKDGYVRRILQDRKHEQVLAADRASMMRAKPSIWDSPLTIGLVIGCVALIGLLIFVLSGGQ